MGEARRMVGSGNNFPRQVPQQQQQIQVDLSNSVPKECSCGCKYFVPAVMIYVVSALISPTGQELMAQQPALVCMECKTAFTP